MISNTDAAYIAGLFDGEGTICYKQYVERKKKHTGKGYRTTKTWRINMEIAMTDRSVKNQGKVKLKAVANTKCNGVGE